VPFLGMLVWTQGRIRGASWLIEAPGRDLAQTDRARFHTPSRGELRVGHSLEFDLRVPGGICKNL